MIQDATPITVSSQSDDRRATWLELFYDLVYVIAVAKLNSFYNREPSAWRSLAFVGLFVVVWWAWVGYTVFATRFDRGDRFQRAMTLGQMLAAIGLAVQLPNALGDGATGFTVAYLLLRLGLVTLYADARRHRPDSAKQIGVLIPCFLVGVTCWAVSLLVPSPWKWGLWALGIAIDAVAPIVASRSFRFSPVHTAHLPERFGLFTLIVLGESVMAVVNGLDVVEWDVAAVVAGGMAFAVAAAIWWSYFTYVERAPLQCSLGNGRAYIYLHLPLLLGLATTGVGVNQMLLDASADRLQPMTTAILGAGLAAFWAAFMAVQFVTYPRTQHGAIRRRYLPAIGVCLLLAVMGHVLPPLLTMAAYTLTMALLASGDVRHRAAMPARAYVAAANNADTRKHYPHPAVTVSFDAGICVHSGECLRRLPEVFDVAARPWVRLDRASHERVRETVRHCPSGALRIEGDTPIDVPSPVTAGAVVTLVPQGPVIIDNVGRLEPRDPAGTGDTGQLSLCRCGRSAAHPYCDGSHLAPPVS